MAELHTDIRYIKGIGEQRAKTLARLGLYTLGDVIGYFPRSYEDRTVLSTVENAVKASGGTSVFITEEGKGFTVRITWRRKS